MIKNLFKRNMLVIFAVAILCSGIITYSFIRSASSTNSFMQSGYVHVDLSESEDKRVLFSGGSKYKDAVNSQIQFTDVSNVERNIASDNFIHYDDNSIASFTDGVLVNIDELTSEESAMNHFHISSGMPLRSNGSSYTAEKTGAEVDFTNFLWKLSENKYLIVSKSIKAHFSETDERDAGQYAEVTYLGGNVIQIQTEDNVWQTISSDCKLLLDNSDVVDLSMKNIQDQNNNVLLDFSRIILDSNNNIELTPMSEDMESLNENVIPHFTVNNTPGDSGEDGQSGGEGLKGESGNNGQKGKQGNEGLSAEEREQSDIKQMPVFSVMDWEVGPTSCSGKIYVEDNSEVLLNSGDLVSQIYLVDLETGESIQIAEDKKPSAYNFADIRNNESLFYEFEFKDLKTDHSYMLYATAPIQISDDTAPYSRGFVSKTFWTDSVGIYMESGNVDADNYDVVIHNTNINNGMGVYVLKYPFEDYNIISTLRLDDFLSDKYKNYIYKSTTEPIWNVVHGDDTVVAGVHTLNYGDYIKIDTNSTVEVVNGLKSNTYYYTVLLFDADGDGAIDDYSTQILATQTLKKRPTVTAPSLTTNKTIGGFDITPGIVNDEDGAVTKYAVEFYNLDSFEDKSVETSELKLKEGAEPVKTIYLNNNSPTSVSLSGLNYDEKNYVVREILTVYDNEKDYLVYSNFSNKAHLEESLTPYVYFEPLGTEDAGTASPISSTSPYYDSLVGILHVYPDANSYMYAINEYSLIEIQGDSYSINFGLKDATSTDLPSASDDLGKFPAFKKESGEIEIYLMDYVNSDKSWASGLRGGQEYYITVYGSLYSDINNPEGTIVEGKQFTTVGKCSVKTPATLGLHMVMSTSPSNPNLLKGLSLAAATPNQLNNTMGVHLNTEDEPNNESYYNRQLDMLYGFTISVYKNDHSQKYAYELSDDIHIIPGKDYYINEGGNFFTKITDGTILSDNTKNPHNENWYEYKETELPVDDFWFSKTFTKDTPYTTGSDGSGSQVYKLYDSESAWENIRNGVQVVGIPRTDGSGIVDYIMSSNGTIPEDPANYTYVYINYTYNTGTGGYDHAAGRDGNITSQVIEGHPNRYTLRPLYEISRLFESDIQKNRNSSNDYIVSSGGFIFDEADFSVNGKTFEQAVLGDDGIIKTEGVQGITIVIESIFDYTYDNPNDIATGKQNTVRELTTDRTLTLPADKVYYRKIGTMYKAVNFDNLNPYDLGLYEYGPSGYELSTDTAFGTSKVYYYFYENSYYTFNSDNINPAAMGWYVNTDNYINYFENVGKERIYISFSRSIGDIDLELPYTEVNGNVYKEDAADGKIVRHTVTDDDQYHYYYTAQANFTNSNQLADTITYRIYDAVDFYNTLNHKNNDGEYINWALLGKDPRVTNPNDIFTDTWVMQDIQTTGNVTDAEYVYQQVQITGSAITYGSIKPYMYGWYEKVGATYVLTDDAKIENTSKYYIDNGTATPTQLSLGSNDQNVSPAALHWFEETIVPASGDSVIDNNKTYYARKNNAGEVEYSMINTDDISPIGLSWYENDAILGYQLSNDTGINTSKTYYYYTGSGNTYASIDLTKAQPGSVSPKDLGWCYGNKVATTKTSISSADDRFFIKYSINVHTTDDTKYANNSGFAHYDTSISPSTSGYKEYAKQVATTNTIQANTRYYTRYLNEAGKDCYTLVDLNANENRSKNPMSEGWLVDNIGSKVDSNDRYFDTQKEYFTAGGTAVSINPSSKGWYEKSYVSSQDTSIDYSKRYYVYNGSTYDRVDPNINPKELKWAEYAKTAVGTNTNYDVADTTKYYAKVGENYVLVTNPINPKAIKWYEGVKKLTEDASFVNTKTYYERVLDENWDETYEVFNSASVNPKELKWREYDAALKEKVITSDESIVTTKTYYVPVGSKHYVEYDASTTLSPSTIQLFEEVKELSNDVKANNKKIYYSSATSTTPIDISAGFKIGSDGAGWYKDNTGVAKIVTADQSYDESKTYFVSTSSTTDVSTTFSPVSFGWYEEGWKKSTDGSISNAKQYAVRYITNINAASAVTTEGLELAKITLKYNGSATPSIIFYPCTETYAKAHYSVNSNANNVFFPDDTFEEMYGHQYIITWTINYHSDETVDWHYVYPFDASAKIQQAGGASEFDKTFAGMAEDYANITLSNMVLGFYDSAQASTKLPNGVDTVFGKNAYMAIPHNYIELDEPKQKPTSYALQWDSGKEESSDTTPIKFVTTRVLLTDSYNAVFNHKANNTSDPFDYAGVYVAGDNKSLVDMRINNTPAETVAEINAVDDIVKAKYEDDYIVTVGTGGDAKKYAVAEIKVTNKDDTHSYIDATKGYSGSIPVVTPIQLYSNKYVKQKQSLHIASANTYVIGSSDSTVGTDSNWKFNNGTTVDKDKYAPLFTAVFNKDSNVVASTNAATTSTLKMKTKVVNQEITGYDLELIASPDVLKDVIGVRLTFDICDYRDATATEITSSPTMGGKESLGVFETIPSKSLTTDTSVVKDKAYYYNKGITYNLFKITEAGGTFDTITPDKYNWYEKTGVDEYTLTTDISYDYGKEYYYESAADTYTKIVLDTINPTTMGWYEDTYNDVKWSTDTNVVAGKTYLYQTDDVLYSMTIDKYLPTKIAESDGYSQGREVKMLEYNEADNMIHMYFGLGAEELQSDPEYNIGGAFANKQGIRVHAEYLYESDRAGYSHVKVSDTLPSGNDTNFYSTKVDSVINNKESGAFAIRRYTLVSNATDVVNGYYFNGEQNIYLALSGETSGTSTNIVDNSANVYSVTNKDKIDNYTLDRFGSFFSVGTEVNAANDEKLIRIKTTRYQSNPKTQDLALNAKVANNTQYYVPAVLETRKDSKIEIQSWKNSAYTSSHSFGIIEFPKSSLYVDFENETAPNDGATVSRQNAKLNYAVYNADSTNQIYALITVGGVVDVNIDAEHRSTADANEFTSCIVKGGEGGKYTIITNFDSSNNEIVPKITTKAIYQTFTGTGANKPTAYFNKINTAEYYPVADNAYTYEDLFIPVKVTDTGVTIDNTGGITLDALPYASNYSVSFWIWSLINETAAGVEYGWVSVPYSNLKAKGETLDFATSEAPKPAINDCFVSYGKGDAHLDGYNNKTLTVSLKNTSADLYYVVELFDNSTGTSTSVSHLYVANGIDSTSHTFDLDGLYDTGESEYANPLVLTGTKVVKSTQALDIDKTSATNYTSFRYGKVNETTDRYTVKLRAYLNGTGPAAYPDINTYNWNTDPDAVYNVYRYSYDSSTGDITKDTTDSHILKVQVPEKEKTFSINNEYDLLEKNESSEGIHVTNRSNLVRNESNGPSIRFTVNLPEYKSYSIPYEQYIPVIVWLHNGTAVDITDKVFKDAKFGDTNKKLGGGSTNANSVEINGNTYYVFDYDTPETFEFTADIGPDAESWNTSHPSDKVENYGFSINDTIQIFLMSYQDEIQSNKDNNYLTQIGQAQNTGNAETINFNMNPGKAQTQLKSALETLLGTSGVLSEGGKLYPSNDYNICHGEATPITGIRIVSAIKTNISSKLIKLDPVDSGIKGTYTDDQLKQLEKKKNAEEKVKKLQQEYDAAVSSKEAARQKLAELEQKLADAAKPAEIQKYVDDNFNAAAKVFTDAGVPLSDDLKNQIRQGLEANYENIVLNPIRIDLDQARINYGHPTSSTSDNNPVYYLPNQDWQIGTSTSPNVRKANKTGEYSSTGAYTPYTSSTPGNIQQAKGASGDAEDARIKLEEAQREYDAIDVDPNRYFDIAFKLNSESIGTYGKANVTITFKKNDSQVFTKTYNNLDVIIDSTKGADGYQCRININKNDLHTAFGNESTSGYNKIELTINFNETNHSNTQIILSSIDKNTITMEDVKYTSTTSSTGDVTWEASRVYKTYQCTGSAVAGDSGESPSATFTFQ